METPVETINEEASEGRRRGGIKYWERMQADPAAWAERQARMQAGRRRSAELLRQLRKLARGKK